MKHRTRSVRIALAALLFSTAMSFGAFQVVAGDGTGAQAESEACSAWKTSLNRTPRICALTRSISR